jgi:hypothetical protein
VCSSCTIEEKYLNNNCIFKVDSTTNTNEYQEYFLGVKAAGSYGLQLYHLHVPIVLKSGSLNFLETSRPAQAYFTFLPNEKYTAG